MQISTQKPAVPDEWLSLIARQVAQLRFGEVQIVVHDSRVVQIERTEKLRLPSSASSPIPGVPTAGSMTDGLIQSFKPSDHTAGGTLR